MTLLITMKRINLYIKLIEMKVNMYTKKQCFDGKIGEWIRITT